MKKLIAIAAIAMAIASPALARPQLHTASIGWISSNDIRCEATSDHTCFVREDSDDDFVTTFTAWKPYLNSDHPNSENLYRVKAGTELVILDSKGSDLFNDPGNPKGDVEVAIVIPADWGKDGELHPLKHCHLKKVNKRGDIIVSLACK